MNYLNSLERLIGIEKQLLNFMLTNSSQDDNISKYCKILINEISSHEKTLKNKINFSKISSQISFLESYHEKNYGDLISITKMVIESLEKILEIERIQTQQNKKNILLLSTTQMMLPLSYLDGILSQEKSIQTTILGLGTNAGVYSGKYPKDIVEQTNDFIKERNVGSVYATVIEFELERTWDLLEKIKDANPKLQIVVGGQYAIEYPDNCIGKDFVDIVYYTKNGEFANKIITENNLMKVPNIIFRNNGRFIGQNEIIKTGVANIAKSIDDVVLPKHSLDNRYILYNPSWYDENKRNVNVLVNLKHSGGSIPTEHHQVPAKNTGIIISSEGCYLACEFCAIARMNGIAQKQFKEEKGGFGFFKPKEDNSVSTKFKSVSWYSPEKALSNVLEFKKKNPNMEYILFNDNDFATIPKESYSRFLELYTEYVNLPFYVQNTPNETNRKGLDFLKKMIDAGLDTYTIGIQGDEGINKDWRRTAGNKKVIESVKLLHQARDYAKKKHNRELYLGFDFINGIESATDEQLKKSVELARAFQLPWDLAIHNLTLNEENELQKKIKRIAQEHRDMGSKSNLKIEDSDYHNADFNNFRGLIGPYYNSILQLMGGSHTVMSIGCIARSFDDFKRQIEIVLNKYPELVNLINSNDYHQTYDFLLDERTEKFFNSNLDILEEVYNSMPPILYSYHRKDRYDYNWSWADKQIKK